MKKYTHINKMEKILNNNYELIEKFNEFLNLFEKNKSEYSELIEYYYSDNRKLDILDDEKNLIPKSIKRAVLSEDAIYNLIFDYHCLGIKLMELGLELIKNN